MLRHEQRHGAPVDRHADDEDELPEERGDGRPESEDVEGHGGGGTEEEAPGEHDGVEAVEV